MDSVPPIQPPPTNMPPGALEPEPEPLKLLPGIPFPPFIIVLAAITLIAFVVGLTRLPSSISMGINYEKAMHFIEINQPKRAVELLKPIAEKYDHATDVRIELAKAHAMAGQVRESAEILQTFEGKQVSKEENAKLDEVASILDRQLPVEKTQP